MLCLPKWRKSSFLPQAADHLRISTPPLSTTFSPPRNTTMTPFLDDALLPLNDLLSARIWLVGAAPTVADVALFATVHEALSGLTTPQRAACPHILRWATLCQAEFNRAGILPAISFPSDPVQLPDLSALMREVATSQSQKDSTKKDKDAQKGDGKKEKGSKKDNNAKAGDDQKTDSKKREKAAPAGPSGEAHQEKNKNVKEKEKDSQKEKKKEPAATGATGKAGPSMSQLDIRVGTILECGPHPDAESLYVEQIDLGEPSGPRTVVSGLRKFVPVAEMQNRRVCVVINLKPAKMRGVESSGLVLCASNASHEKVSPIYPPAGAANGDRITVEGEEGDPEGIINESKKKVFATVSDEFNTDDKGVPMYRGKPFRVGDGICSGDIPHASVK